VAWLDTQRDADSPASTPRSGCHPAAARSALQAAAAQAGGAVWCAAPAPLQQQAAPAGCLLLQGRKVDRQSSTGGAVSPFEGFMAAVSADSSLPEQLRAKLAAAAAANGPGVDPVDGLARLKLSPRGEAPRSGRGMPLSAGGAKATTAVVPAQAPLADVLQQKDA